MRLVWLAVCQYGPLLIIGAHAQRRLQYFVCLPVCYPVFCHHAQQTGQKATPTVPRSLHLLHFITGDFRKNTVFKMQFSTGLLRLGAIALCTLVQEVTTKGVYRLPHARARVRLSASY